MEWKWSYSIGENIVTRKQELAEWKALIDTLGI